MIFSKIDLMLGYYQLNIWSEDIEKMAFRTRYGHKKFLGMSFRLANVATSFISLMTNIFKSFLNYFYNVY